MSFRATFGLTRWIWGWEEGERRERNKRKRQPGQTGAGQRGSPIPALALSLFLQRLNFLLFLQRLYLSLRAVRSAAILLFVLRRFVLAASSACFFPFFLPPPNPQNDRVSPNVALKLVTKPILFNRLSGLSD